MSKRFYWMSVVLWMAVSVSFGEEPGQMVDVGEPFGKLKLIDAVNCGDPQAGHEFTESTEGVSRIETVLGEPSRVMPNEGDQSKFFAYLIGKGKNLQAGAAYVLTVEYPEDVSRSLFIVNRGSDTNRGLFTGQAVGDALHTWVNSNPESLKIPLSGNYQIWKTMFFLHDRFRPLGENKETPRPMTPADGFWVAIAQPEVMYAPVSAGAAVRRICLYEVPNPEQYYLTPRFPEGLPQRHLFYREEASDGTVSGDKTQWGVKDDADFFEYQMRIIKYLGMDTFSRDLLEWGHNQGWDSVSVGGPDWCNASSTPQRWERTLERVSKYGLNVLPYYEYSGLVGKASPGVVRRTRPLGQTNEEGHFTHIAWSEKANCDVTDPVMLTETQRMLEATIVRFKDKVPFLGAWIRPRPGAMPIGFSDDDLERFTTQTNRQTPVTRDQLQQDNELLSQYYDWWFLQRRAFLMGLRDYLRENGLPEAVIFFTADIGEPGVSLKGGRVVVTDDVELWNEKLSEAMHEGKIKVKSCQEVSSGDYLDALTSIPPTWGQWEWQHGCPWHDPQNYKDTDGVLLTMTFNRQYTVNSPETFDAFRTPDGLAIVRHYMMNEEIIKNKVLGQFLSDAERAGPYCMMGEAYAMANGDPRFLGYLTTITFNCGFPQYVRNFNQAFLALPALPSEKIDAGSDEEVVVRKIETEGQGTYLAIVNTGMGDKKAVTITLPCEGEVTNAATGEPMEAVDGKLTLDLYPCQLMAVQVK